MQMPTNKPLISVVIPAFNAQKYIAEAIDSVLNQTWKNWELLVVDDCSTDDTYHIVKKYSEKDSKIGVFRLRENSGCPAVPRNYAIKRSRGKYVAFLDSDDVWLENKLEMQAYLMESNEETALSYVLFSHLLEDGSIKGEYPKPKHRFEGHIFKYLYLKPVIANSSVMVRRDVFEEFGLLNEDIKLAFSEDYDMWLRIARLKPVHYVRNGPLLLYRTGSYGTFKKAGVKEFLRLRLVAKKYSPYAGRGLYFIKTVSLIFYLIREFLQTLIKWIKDVRKY